MTEELRECLCGCGVLVAKTARFVAGHDKRLADLIISQLGGWRPAILIAQGVELARQNAVSAVRKDRNSTTGEPT